MKRQGRGVVRTNPGSLLGVWTSSREKGEVTFRDPATPPRRRRVGRHLTNAERNGMCSQTDTSLETNQSVMG